MEPTKATFGRIVPNPKLKLLDQVREVCRLKYFSLRTEECYVGWVKRFLVFVKQEQGQWRHPRELGAAEVTRFLSDLAADARVSASTQNQALNALVFLFREVLGQALGDLGDTLRASRPKRLPVVLTREEVRRL